MLKKLVKRTGKENQLTAYYGCSCECVCYSCASTGVPDYERMRILAREWNKDYSTNNDRAIS